MKFLMSILLLMLNALPSFATQAIVGDRSNDFEHIVEYGTHYLICGLKSMDGKADADLVFVWDELDEETAWVFLLLKEDLQKDVNDHMLAFNGDLDQVFPMNRFEEGDLDRDLLCMVKRVDLFKFLYELTKSNTRIMKLSLNSEEDVTREWVLFIDYIPEYINH